ncbi:MAG: hypothetical protein HOP08_19895 [Cyclobacteriaceae bacterium]|nr:hypothetical protein [Cyclobacteriaceae bacterium]
MTLRNKVTLLFAIILIGTGSCSRNTEKSPDYSFEQYIRFNHLYIVIDSTTYELLSGSNSFLKEFSGVVESQSDSKDESWSGKYLYGKGHYLEIFKPGGYPGSTLGNVGLGFMPTKMGTLDSLYKRWSQTEDSVDRKDRTILDNGVNYPWFTALSIYDADSLQLRVFLLENAKEDMLYSGFTEKDLQGEIEYWDYMRYYRAHVRKTSPDSIRFTKLFEKIETIHLTVSEKELHMLTQHLQDFGFQLQGRTFRGRDIDITYNLDNNPHRLLQRIDFKLTDSLAAAEFTLNKLSITVKGRNASFRFQN